MAALIPLLRRLLGQARTSTGRVAAFAGRGTRGLHYLWHLLIWSRISAGRSGLLPIELPLEVLSRKGVEVSPPHLRIAGHAQATAFERGFAEVYALLFANLQQADLLSPTRHAIPGPAFRGVYLWDSAFIAQVWRWWDAGVGADVLRAVIDLRDGDRLQHVVTEFHQSRYTQPPLIAWSVLGILDALPQRQARALLVDVYVPLHRYQAWLESNRQLDNGLYAWAHPYESGVENAPRFSNTDESRLRDTRRIAAADFSSYVVVQLETLAQMARRLAQEQEASAFAAKAATLRRRINQLLWDEQAGLYLDRAEAGHPIRISTIASLMPLWAGVPDQRRAARLAQHLSDPSHFGTQIPLPSVARKEPSFEKDMWRGPVWINTAYAVVQGLLRYDRQREAGEIAFRLCQGVYGVFERERRIYEFYDPDALHTQALRRKDGNWWKALTLGRGPQREFVGWSGLVNNLLLEVLLGLELGPARWSLCPRLPRTCRGMHIEIDLPIFGSPPTALDPGPRRTQRLGSTGLSSNRVQLQLRMRDHDRFEGSVCHQGSVARFHTGFAERVLLDRLLQKAQPCATAT
ncbi:MGH1-like glycoside hydrolase domain-containing protein [Halochromatium sp.]